MTFKTSCPHCAVALTVKYAIIGKMVSCPKCKESFLIQSPIPSSDLKKNEIEDLEDFGVDSDNSSVSAVDEFEYSKLPSLPKKPAKKVSVQKLNNEPEQVPNENLERKRISHNPWLWMSVLGIPLFIGSVLVGYYVTENSRTIEPVANPIPTDNHPSAESRTPMTSAPSNSKPEVNQKNKVHASSKSLPAGIQSVLDAMRVLLESGDDQEFLIQFSPIEELKKLQRPDAATRRIPEVPRETLLRVINAISLDGNEVQNDGLVAVLEASTSEVLPQEWLPMSGYEGDVNIAIKSAITDIEKGRIKEFILNMIPPNAIRAMLRSGQDRSVASIIDRDSALLVRMLQDLKSLAAEKPVVTGDVAEFLIPSVPYDQERQMAIRPAGQLYRIPDRVIRFSRINGRWHFYDDGALVKTGSLSGSIVRLEFERVGSSWRLVRYPRS